MERNIIICGYNIREAEGVAMMYIKYAGDNDMKVSFVTDSNRRVHVRLGEIQSRYILKGDAEVLVASDVYEAVRNIDYLKTEGKVRITENYIMTDERYMRYSKKKCYEYLRSLKLI